MLETIAFGLLILSVLLYGVWRAIRANTEDADERKSKKKTENILVGLYFWKPRGWSHSDAISMTHSSPSRGFKIRRR